MELSKRSLMYRYLEGAIAEPDYRIKSMTLCSLFWRLAGATVLYGLCVAIIVILIGFIFIQPIITTIVFGLALLIGGGIVIGVYIYDRRKQLLSPMVLEGLAAIKGKFCPIIQLKD